MVALVALASAGLGFVARGFVGSAPPPPALVAEAPVPVTSHASAPAGPGAAPGPAVVTEPPVAAVTADPRAPAAAVAAALPNPSAQAAPVQLAASAPAPAAAPKAPQAPALRQITVPYKNLEGQAQRIIIPVKLNDRVTAEMALDTGAPGTIIFVPLAKRLGVMDEGANRLMTTAGGIGGRTPALLVILESLSVDEARTEFVPATVTMSLTEAFEGLVGMDFLAGYSVHIDTQQHRLVLTELPGSGARPAGHDEAWWRRTFTQLDGQQALWRGFNATLKEQVSSANVSSKRISELLRYAERQEHEAELLAARLERYASLNAVPREWRRE